MANTHRELMKGIFGKVYLDPAKRKTGQVCDGCGQVVCVGRRVYRIGMYSVCGSCAILAGRRIVELVGLFESAWDRLPGEERDLFEEDDPGV